MAADGLDGVQKGPWIMNYVDTTEEFTVVELCAGYSGISIGVGRVEPTMRVIASCEIEGYVVANLVAKMEVRRLDPAPIWTNVKTFPFGSFYRRVRLLLAGFPCQPFSHAGQRNGTQDERHLYPYISAGIAAMLPDAVLLENVEGIISAKCHGQPGAEDGEPVLLYVLRDLEKRGYRATWGVFSALEIGTSHQRKRVFIYAELAHAKHDARSTEQRIEPGRRGGEASEQNSRTWESGESDVDHANGARCDGEGHGSDSDGSGRKCVPGTRRADVAESLGHGERGGGQRGLGEEGREVAERQDGASIADQPVHGSKALAEPTSGGLGELRQSSGSDRQPHRGDEGMADADAGREQQPLGTDGEKWGRSGDGGVGVEPVADACPSSGNTGPERSRREARPDADRSGSGTGLEDARRAAGGRCASAHGKRGERPPEDHSGASGVVGQAHSILPGLEGHAGNGAGGDGQGWQPSEPQRPVGAPGILPKHPPGPNDIESWNRVLEIAPHLEPAVECPVRGVAYGNSHRLDRLRLCGNGVHPDTAELAYRTLKDRLRQ